MFIDFIWLSATSGEKMKETTDKDKQDKIEKMRKLNTELLDLEHKKHLLSMRIKELEKQIVDSW